MAKKAMSKSEVPAAAAPAPDAAPEAAKTKSSKPRATPAIPAEAAAATQPLMVTDEMISERAYHKWKNGEPGDPDHHWTSSERELRDGN